MTQSSPVNLKDPPLVRVHWNDAYNIATWMNSGEVVEEIIQEGNFKAVNIGYLIYEDDDCVVVAGRHGKDSVGLVERIPRGMVTRIERLRPYGPYRRRRS